MRYLPTLRTSDITRRLMKGTQISDSKCVRCYLQLFLGGAAANILKEI